MSHQMYSVALKLLTTPTACQLAGANDCAMSMCKSSAVIAMLPWGQAEFKDSGTYIQTPVGLTSELTQHLDLLTSGLTQHSNI